MYRWFPSILRGGFWGAWAGGWSFILPNFIIVAALGALYVYLGCAGTVNRWLSPARADTASPLSPGRPLVSPEIAGYKMPGRFLLSHSAPADGPEPNLFSVPESSFRCVGI